MKKLLTITLAFVFVLALVVALGCQKKEATPEGGMESGMEQGMEQAPAPMDSAAMASPDTAMAPSGH